MRMYLGHICTVVLLPSCHPHCLSYLAFMYCRTKHISPVCFLSPQRRCGVLFFKFLYIMNFFLFVSLALQLHLISSSRSCLWPLSMCSCPVLGSAFIWLYAFCSLETLLWSQCVSTWADTSIHNCVPCLMLHFIHLFKTLIYESLYTNHPPCDCYVHWTCLPCLWLNFPSCYKKEIW